MVIVHIITRLLRAGSEENTLASCRAQRAAGHRVILIHGKEVDPTMRVIAAEAAEVVCVPEMIHPISPIADGRATFKIVALLRQIRADVVHTHQSKAGVIGRMAAYIAGIPRIVHGVHILPFLNVGAIQKVVYISAERLCASFTDAFISVSPSVRDLCIATKIGAPNKHFVAFSAMDVDRFKGPSRPKDWRRLLNVPEGAFPPPTAVMLAAFEPRKRHIEFIKALPEAFVHLKDWRVLFAGEGETEQAARKAVSELGLTDKVRFAGYRQDPEAMIALADVCLLTSEREGLPRVLVQYAAAGKPCVASRIPGIEDVVTHGVNSIITPGDDVSAAARAAAQLLSNPEQVRHLADGAKKIDVDAWSVQRMTASIESAYAAMGIADRNVA